MKKIITLFLTLILCLPLFSEENLQEVKEYALSNGIPVYVKNPGENHIRTLFIVVKGGVNYLNPKTAGLEDAVFSMMTTGSSSYSYEDLKSFSYKTQSSISSSSSKEGSVFEMVSIDKHFDETFARFSDCFLNPLFDEKQFFLRRKEFEQSIQEKLNNPVSMLFYHAGNVIYSGNLYETSSKVTPDSLENITLSNIKNLYAQLIDSRRISIVACGNYDVKFLIPLLENAFGKIKPQNYPIKDSSPEKLHISGKPCVFVHEDCGNNAFVMRAFPAPSVNNPDYAASVICGEIYSSVLYNVVRENYGVCYSPESSVSGSKAAFGYEFLYQVSDLEKFSSALSEARNYMLEGKLIKGRDEKGNYLFDTVEERLPGYINSYINSKYSSLETTFGIGSRLCSSLLIFGDVMSIEKLTDYALKTTPEDIHRIFQKYWINEDSRWFAVTSPENEEKIKF